VNYYTKLLKEHYKIPAEKGQTAVKK